MRVLLLTLLLALPCVVPAVASATPEGTSLPVGEEAPPFMLKTINGAAAKIPRVALDDYAGSEAGEKKKLVLISFFATYCAPCKRELPFLTALYNEYKDKGLMVMSVAIDKDPAELAKVDALIAEHKLEHPVLSDKYQVVAKRYLVEKLPCLYMIDGERKITKVALGYDEKGPGEILAGVQQALGVPAARPASLAKFLGAPK